MYRSLPADVFKLLVYTGGLVDAPDLAGLGWSRHRLRTLCQRRLLVPIAKGIYTSAALLDALDPWARLALRTAAFLRTAPDDAKAASWSAVAVNDLPGIGRPPELPCVIRPVSPPHGSDRSPWGRTRHAGIDDDWTVTVPGLGGEEIRVLRPAVTVVDLAQRTGRLAALVVADAVARLDGGNGGMSQALDGLRHWPRIAHARWVVARADGACESPLETVGRYAVLRGGLPAPRSNVWVGIDRPRYRLDHYWVERRLALEGDGVGKYRLARPGQGSGEGDALLEEKDREFELRQWGVTTERYTWRRALFEPALISDRCSSLLAAPMLPAHPGLRWWPAEEGYRLRGMPVPRTQLGAGPGWRERVAAALLALRR